MEEDVRSAVQKILERIDGAIKMCYEMHKKDSRGLTYKACAKVLEYTKKVIKSEMGRRLTE